MDADLRRCTQYKRCIVVRVCQIDGGGLVGVGDHSASCVLFRPRYRPAKLIGVVDVPVWLRDQYYNCPRRLVHGVIQYCVAVDVHFPRHVKRQINATVKPRGMEKHVRTDIYDQTHIQSFPSITAQP